MAQLSQRKSIGRLQSPLSLPAPNGQGKRLAVGKSA